MNMDIDWLADADYLYSDVLLKELNAIGESREVPAPYPDPMNPDPDNPVPIEVWPTIEPHTERPWTVESTEEILRVAINKIIFLGRSERTAMRLFDKLKDLEASFYNRAGRVESLSYKDYQAGNIGQHAKQHAAWLWQTFEPNKYNPEHPLTTATRLGHQHILLLYCAACAELHEHRLTDGVCPLLLGDLLLDNHAPPLHTICSRPETAGLVRAHPAPLLHTIMDANTHRQLATSYRHAVLGFDARLLLLQQGRALPAPSLPQFLNHEGARVAMKLSLKEVLELIRLARDAYEAITELVKVAHEAYDKTVEVVKEREKQFEFEHLQPVRGAENYVDQFDKNKEALASTC